MTELITSRAARLSGRGVINLARESAVVVVDLSVISKPGLYARELVMESDVLKLLECRLSL